MSFFLNLPTMQRVYIILAVFVCHLEINKPFILGFKVDYQDGDEVKRSGFKKEVYSEEKKTVKKTTSQEAFESDTESFLDLGVSPPPEHENDKIIKNTHKYYNSSFILNSEDAISHWVDLDKMPEEEVISHSMLSGSHRQAATVVLSFDFPFYGQNLRNITIATGGFLYMGDYLHNWIAATQYIAPLMANFDTSLSNSSIIKYADTGSSFTVQWDKVGIQDKSEDGYFTFQATLIKNGDIIFAYKEIPYPVTEIPVTDHPLKIGLSDAYIMHRQVYYWRRKTIYEYHRIDFLKETISNNTAIYFTALPTCLSFIDCESCITADKSLECSWCEAVKRCSDGVDRQRQSWLQNGCLLEGQIGVCPNVNSNKTVFTTSVVPYSDIESKVEVTYTHLSSQTPLPASRLSKETDFDESFSIESTTNASNIIDGKDKIMESYIQEISPEHSVGPGAIVTIILVLAGLFGIGFWVCYAYKFPQSSSGQFLIKYRPSQWSAKPEESSCNSASLHM